ncbi:hypothetical protein B0H10DRAFT_2218646 [Mycena sp. CBHHK59/15]|nr:hypothetical protein B0H10DRAFT_2218646 [Mycena sp. CBHHK59/15]
MDYSDHSGVQAPNYRAPFPLILTFWSPRASKRYNKPLAPQLQASLAQMTIADRKSFRLNPVWLSPSSESLDRDPQSPDSPSDAYDRSQVLTIGTSVIPPSEYTGTLQFFRQNHDFLFTESTFFPDRPMRGRTQTSSTMNGLDVYLLGSMLGRAHNANRYCACFQDLDTDFAFDPRTHSQLLTKAFLMAGSIAGWTTKMKSSRFSMTTTSTSNYVTVENEMEEEVQPQLVRARHTRHSVRSRALLAQHPHSRNLSLPKFARGLGKWKKTDTAGWVWIDVKEEQSSS